MRFDIGEDLAIFWLVAAFVIAIPQLYDGIGGVQNLKTDSSWDEYLVAIVQVVMGGYFLILGLYGATGALPGL